MIQIVRCAGAGRILLFAGGLILGLHAWPARAATFTVNSTTDAPAAASAIAAGLCADAAGACTLRAAVQVADAAAAPSTIVIPAGTYNLAVQGVDEAPSSATSPMATVLHTPDPAIGDLNITRSMTINGAGAGQTIVQWDPSIPPAQRDRVFHVEAVDADITVAIRDLTIRNGYTPPPVVLSTMSATEVVQFMRFGGGIASGAAASVETVNPQATHGQGSGGAGSEGHGGGGSHEGETGFVVDQLTLDSVHVLDNEAGSDGGGIYSAAPLQLFDSVVSGNVAGANGGGLYNDAALTMQRTTLGRTAAFTTGNSAENGGGLFDTGFHDSNIEASAIVGNSATGGGGIAARRLVLENITNTTVADNTAQDVGGGITTNGRTVLTNATVAGNIVASDTEGGGAGLNGFGPAGGGSTGGGAAGGNFTLVNTILSGNVVQGASVIVANCGGTGEGATSNRFYSLGHNIENGDTCGLAASGDLINTDPLLKPLADNGGPTQTMALPSTLMTPADPVTSPAVDAGDNAHCPNNDQRGQLRPADGTLDGNFICDIGAFELFVPSADLHIQDLTAPDSVFVGDPFDVTVTLHVGAGATADAQGVQLATAALPPELTLNSATLSTPAGTSTCGVSAGIVTCDVGTLAVDQYATATLNLTANSPVDPLTISVQATATSPADPRPGNNAAQAQIAALGLSDLALSASGTTDPVDVGSSTDVSFTVKNDGPHAAAPVTLGIVLPLGVTYSSVSVAGGNCDASDPTALLCTVPSIAAGGSASGTLTVTGAAEGTAAIALGTYAPQRDDHPGDDTATVNLAIRGLSDLALTGGFAAGSASRGNSTSLRYTVVNHGPTDAPDTRLVVQLPDGAVFSQVSGSAPCTVNGRTATCEFGTLAVGGSVSVAFTIFVDTDTSSLTVSADVSSGKTDPNMADNRSTSTVSAADNGGGGTGGAGLGALFAVLLAGAIFRRRRMKQMGRR